MTDTLCAAAPVKLDWEAMPDYVKRDIFASAWRDIQDFMKRPDAQELLDAERELLRREGSTLLEPKTSPGTHSPPEGGGGHG